MTVTLKACAIPPSTMLGKPARVGGLPFAVGLLMDAFVTAVPFEAQAGRNAKALPTSRNATTRTDSLVVSFL